METLNCVERTVAPCAGYTMLLHTTTTSHSRNSEVLYPPKHIHKALLLDSYERITKESEK